MGLLIIPEPYKVGFKKIASLEESAIGELHAAYNEVKPAIYAKEIAEQITGRVGGVPDEDLVNITETLFSLYVSRATQGDPLDEFVKDVVHTIEESDFGDLLVQQGARERVVRRLTALLALEPLMIGAKSYILLFDHGQNFRNARVVTDIRPVFGDSMKEPPLAAMIIHHLRIEYLEGDATREFFIAMDNKDVQRLMEALRRAELKSRTLESVFEGLKFTYVEPER